MKIDAVQLAGLLSYVAKAADVDTADSLAGHIAALEQQLEASMSPPSALVVLQIVKAERDAALADNAEILRGVQEMRNLLMYPHDEWHQVAADAIRVGNGLTAVDHPGAALLEGHRKALVRARNEGLEKAAAWFRLKAKNRLAPLSNLNVAKAIDAMKEPESD